MALFSPYLTLHRYLRSFSQAMRRL
ncbi:hypothetical protein NSND_60602 [Nitrospira sp. ND1]|nr:hypothetical protein NSND_60602 [Nitrospira sp. ND1]